jgi:alanine racemase
MSLESIRPTVLDIDLDALRYNFQALQSHVGGAALMPILKANAYGHGLITCARYLSEWGAAYLGVAFVEEGIELRKAGVKIPVLALGGVAGRQIESFLEYDIDLTASSIMKLDAIERVAQKLNKRPRVHLKIDTGMERIGVHSYSARSFLERALACNQCQIVGIFSHFATAENVDLGFAQEQLRRFKEVLGMAEEIGLKFKWTHMANSGAILQLPDSHFNMVRPGLTLFGLAPSQHLSSQIDLRPVASLRSEVVYFKVIPPGVGVSYDMTWQSSEQTRIATVACGYGDGYSRRLSNCGEVLIRGKRYPIVGKVCMDQFMVNLGAGEAYNGDTVILIGRQGDQKIDAESVAHLVQTDIRDVLLSINQRVPRCYHLDGDVFCE